MSSNEYFTNCLIARNSPNNNEQYFHMYRLQNKNVIQQLANMPH